MQFTWIVACFGLALLACGGSGRPQNPTGPPVPIGQEFELTAGQTVTVGADGLKVTFQGVRNDSRCAADVTCIWEGDALVALVVSRPSRPQAELELHTNQGQGPSERPYDGYRLRLVKLMPTPISTRPTDPGSYRVTLVAATS